MYYPDLSAYEYFSAQRDDKTLNVGWLDARHNFHKGVIPEPVLDRLFDFCNTRVNQTRGYQECQFCERPSFNFDAVRNGRTLRLGSAEIRVPGKDGAIYAAPNLIYHYIVDHNYLPPAEFIDALMAASEGREPPPSIRQKGNRWKEMALAWRIITLAVAVLLAVAYVSSPTTLAALLVFTVACLCYLAIVWVFGPKETHVAFPPALIIALLGGLLWGAFLRAEHRREQIEHSRQLGVQPNR